MRSGGHGRIHPSSGSWTRRKYCGVTLLDVRRLEFPGTFKGEWNELLAMLAAIRTRASFQNVTLSNPSRINARNNSWFKDTGLRAGRQFFRAVISRTSHRKQSYRNLITVFSGQTVWTSGMLVHVFSVAV